MKAALALCFAAACCLTPLRAQDTAWPAVTREHKPWTRWWWLGSAVEKPELTRELEDFARGGLGGVEICPIYGAKGAEARSLPFLSPAWLEAYNHTIREATRLQLGVDLTDGTGWPFGGPEVAPGQASSAMKPVTLHTAGGREVTLELPQGTPEALLAWPAGGGEPVDLLPQLREGRLVWQAPAGEWRIHGIVRQGPLQRVKRAAPGGEGWVLDPFSQQAILSYLARFSAALDQPDVLEPRAHFHDSFEYYGATWSSDFFQRFLQQRGYDLRLQLPALQGEGDADIVRRVRADYRETLSDFHGAYLMSWHEWAGARGSLTRNQAHGSPGSLLDHYAVADIPETELFGAPDEAQLPLLQFASSAGHLTGRKLISAESFTWLDEHFRVAPAELKSAADLLWLGGANHLFFHGIPYSPPDAGWPGWLFYASTHLGPNGGLWRDLPAFNAYVARCQSVLQGGTPGADVLLLHPVHDLWHDGREGLPLFTMHNAQEWLQPTPFHRIARELWQSGVSCDFISPALLNQALIANRRLQFGKSSYKAVIVPEVTYLPDSAAWQLQRFAQQGVPVFFVGKLPTETPGLLDYEKGRTSLAKLLAGFQPVPPAELGARLSAAGVLAEKDLTSAGVRFVRRRTAQGHDYFLVHRGAAPIDVRIGLAVPVTGAVMMDPWSGRSGTVPTADGIRLRMAPGESRVLRTFRDRTAAGPAWRDFVPAGEPIALQGAWQVRFLEGGPALPPPFETTKLGSWTNREGAAYRNFSGTACYKLEFELQDALPAAWLDLGEVAVTAKVRLNGKEAGTCWAPPHRVDVGGLLQQGRNVLEIEVTNLAANRIADLDRRGVPWKNFHEINFVNRDYKPFDASSWEPLPSGLLGPVTVIPGGL